MCTCVQSQPEGRVKSSGHPYRTQAARQATTTQKPLSFKQKHGPPYIILYSMVIFLKCINIKFVVQNLTPLVLTASLYNFLILKQN